MKLKLKKIIRLIYHKAEFFFIELDFKDLKDGCENPYNVEFDKYSDKYFKLLDDALRYLGKKWKPFTIDEINRRLAAGHTLFIAKKKDKIIGFFWVATNFCENIILHESIQLNKDEVYDYNSYVFEEYRGKSINKGLKAYGFNVLKQEGYSRVFAHINTTNHRSLRANDKVGFRTIGITRGIRIMTLEFLYHNSFRDKTVFHCGPLSLWKNIFRKVKEKNV